MLFGVLGMVGSQFKKIELPSSYNMDELLAKLKDETKNGLLRGYEDVVSVNGLEGMNGFQVLVELRKAIEQHSLGAQMVVVKTHELTVRFGKIAGFEMIDLVKFRSSSEGRARVEYWFESLDSRQPIVEKRCMSGFEATAYVVSEDKNPYGELKVLVPCMGGEYEEVVKKLRGSERVRISGMLVGVASNSLKRLGQVFHFIVQDYVCTEVDYSGANNIVSRCTDWRELIPMRHYDSGEPLFPEITSLAMMVSALFTREGVPAFNAIFIGPSATGKTSMLRFFVEELLGGSMESATGSAGKMWLISHKEGAPSSRMFLEKRVFLIDEMLKSVSTNQRMNAHSYAVELKDFLTKHMQIIERTPVKSSSGVGVVEGQMVCSFIGTENDDATLIRALGRAAMLSFASMRRIQIGYADREVADEYEDVNSALANQKQMSYFFKKFGASVRKDMASLYLYSRRFTEDKSLEAPKEWKKRVRELVIGEARLCLNGYPSWFDNRSNIDEVARVKLREIFNEFVRLQGALLTPCYVSAAIIHGWELCENLDCLQPVYDERQDEMAVELFKYFFKSKLRILSVGIEDHVFSSLSGVERVRFGGA